MRVQSLALGLVLAACASGTDGEPDPLPSWREGPAKSAILAFVERTTRAGSPDFVAPPERSAGSAPGRSARTRRSEESVRAGTFVT